MPTFQGPFRYYYSKYMKGECPFCNASDNQLHLFENEDVVYCKAHNGYIARLQCEAQMGGGGLCNECTYHDMNYYYPKSPGFLCEACNHGVHFGKKTVFQVLFNSHDVNNCTHCKYHNIKAPENPVEIPDN